MQQLEKDKKVWSTKVNQLEHLREKGKKDNAALIVRCEKALETAKKKYESKQKHFGDIDVEIKSREALIQDCQQVNRFSTNINSKLFHNLLYFMFALPCFRILTTLLKKSTSTIKRLKRLLKSLVLFRNVSQKYKHGMMRL